MMDLGSFLVLWLSAYAGVEACRILPAMLLRGRALSPRVVEALGLVPPAAFAALEANDLFDLARLSAGAWATLAPVLATIVVAVVARRTDSMLWCCVVGVVCYVALSAI